jgi:hypothetical protein
LFSVIPINQKSQSMKMYKHFIIGSLLILSLAGSTLLSCRSKLFESVDPPAKQVGTQVRFINAYKTGQTIDLQVGTITNLSSEFGKLSQMAGIVPSKQFLQIKQNGLTKSLLDTSQVFGRDTAYTVFAAPVLERVTTGSKPILLKGGKPVVLPDTVAYFPVSDVSGAAPSALARIRCVNLSPDWQFNQAGYLSALFYGAPLGVRVFSLSESEATLNGIVNPDQLEGWATKGVRGADLSDLLPYGTTSGYRGINPGPLNFKFADVEIVDFGKETETIGTILYKRIYAPFNVEAGKSYTLVVMGTFDPDDNLPLTVKIINEKAGEEGSVILQEGVITPVALVSFYNLAWNVADRLGNSTGLTLRSELTSMRQSAAYLGSSLGYGLEVPAKGIPGKIRLTYAQSISPVYAEAENLFKPDGRYSVFAYPATADYPLSAALPTPTKMLIAEDRFPEPVSNRSAARIVNLIPDAGQGVKIRVLSPVAFDLAATALPGTATAFESVPATLSISTPSTDVEVTFANGEYLRYRFSRFDPRLGVSSPAFSFIKGTSYTLVLSGTYRNDDPVRAKVELTVTQQSATFQDAPVRGVLYDASPRLKIYLLNFLDGDPNTSFMASLIRNAGRETEFSSGAGPITLYSRTNRDFQAIQSTSFVNGLTRNSDNQTEAKRLLTFLTDKWAEALPVPYLTTNRILANPGYDDDIRFLRNISDYASIFDTPPVSGDPDNLPGESVLASNGYLLTQVGRDGRSDELSTSNAPTDYRLLFGIRDYIKIDDSLNVLEKAVSDAVTRGFNFDGLTGSPVIPIYNDGSHYGLVLPIDRALSAKQGDTLSDATNNYNKLRIWFRKHIFPDIDGVVKLSNRNTFAPLEPNSATAKFKYKFVGNTPVLFVNGRRVLGRITIDRTQMYLVQRNSWLGRYTATGAHVVNGPFPFAGPISVFLVDGEIYKDR